MNRTEEAAQLLERIGGALYGAEWPSAMAEAIQVNRRTVQRWRTGQQPVPAGALEAIAQLALDRAAELAPLAAAARVAAQLAPPGYWERTRRAQE
jgi:transcriptional regulator with XRE-family HTH domain